ncbi:hypothetical protein WJX81_007843 [Elliptochloris bilobata]|uniref:Thioredoxin domain-containing protein n=1 Tax=Elliptochloris bilobata TaxID=381761 RepID=A0AAW1SGW6_9CHLO
MAAVEDVRSASAFEEATQASTLVAVDFWAPWCEPCKTLDEVFALLAADNGHAKFLRVEAEEVPEVTEKLGVTVVPYFAILKSGRVAARVEGADAAALSAAVAEHIAAAEPPHAKPAPAPAAQAMRAAVAEPAVATSDGRDGLSTAARIQQLLASAPVMLFMKGSREAPRCGFSRHVCDALDAVDVCYATFDILGDEEIRQGLKKYSQWPTYPQLYVAGELLGGADIVDELAQTGALRSAVNEALAVSPSAAAAAAPPLDFGAGSAPAVNDGGASAAGAPSAATGSGAFASAPAAAAGRGADAAPGGHAAHDGPAAVAASSGGGASEQELRALVAQQPVMLFMKGTPDAPRCGFSARVVQALRTAGLGFGAFDILTSDAVRQGLKALSDWPTYPQLYAGGELVGGCDIVEEMAQAGVLREELGEMAART